METSSTRSENIRSFIFGVEDSLVSTVGLISGIAVVGVAKPILLLTGIVLIFVEAFSMSTGELLSDNSVKEFQKHHSVPFNKSIHASLVMFFSYFFSGFIVLAPYLFLERSSAIVLSIILSVSTLFALGLLSAHFSGTALVRKGFVMALLGGLAIVIGVAVSSIVNGL